MKTKVLIIEDNVLTIDELEYRLVQMGYEVESATSGTEAIEKVDLYRPDIILSDINLGDGLDGIETIHLINQNHNIPVVYISAYDDNNTINRAHSTEPFAYVMKPIQERELSIAINIALYKSKTEKELKELSAYKNKLFSIIAHDLKSPCSSFMQLTKMIIDNYDNYNKEIILEYLKILYSNSDKTVMLLENLLNWSRSQLNGFVVKKERINLKSFIKPILEQFTDNADKKEVDINVDIDENLFVFIDNRIIEIVLRNIISNAIKFTLKGGNVTIKTITTDASKNILLSINDTGVGMSEDKIKGLFDIESNTTTKGTNNEVGNGLGLILCKDFIKKHGNDIIVRSELGVGSEFSFSLEVA